MKYVFFDRRSKETLREINEKLTGEQVESIIKELEYQIDCSVAYEVKEVV